jgi:cephalosporin hydroxylase/SAM-dependent methyltransferase
MIAEPTARRFDSEAPAPGGAEATPTAAVVEQFQRLWYENKDHTWAARCWLGVPTLKAPTDFWIYQELIYELRPDWIVGCGTLDGGSALFLASICDLVSHGRVLTVDVVAREHRPRHPRIEYLTGSSTSPEVLREVHGRLRPTDTVLVLLDSDHRAEHVRDELAAYADMVSPGSYLIVGDTILDGHPVASSHGPGPREAVDEFLAVRDDFAADPVRERLMFTHNPRGYLRRRADRPTAGSAAPASPEEGTVAGAARPTPAGARPERSPYDLASLPLLSPPNETYARVARRVGTGRSVLELGCATGGFSRCLVDQGCRVTGVERDPWAARQAREHCEEVVVADLEGDEWATRLASRRFEVVLLMDVLEHLAEPLRCLHHARALLAPGGVLIVTLPNVAHASVRLQLLAGGFDYTETGLLDRTHLRFYTRRTAERLLLDGGFVVETLERVERPVVGPAAPGAPAEIGELVDWLGQDPEARTFQLVFVARPLPASADAALQARVLDLSDEVDQLRRQLLGETAPAAGVAPGEPGSVERRLRGVIADLRRAMSEREASSHAIWQHCSALTAQARALREEMRSSIAAHQASWAECERYALSLRAHLDAVEPEMRRTATALANRDAEARASEEARLREVEERRALERRLAATEETLRSIHGSRLWRFATTYWRLVRRS